MFNKAKPSKFSKVNRYYKMMLLLILIFLILVGFFVKSYRESKITNRTMQLLVQADGSVFVEDIWDAKIAYYSTLYQSFDNAKADNFSDIRVSYFNEDSNTWIPMELNERITLDGKEKLNHYHAGMYGGKFEIAWGVGCENKRGKGKYKLEYTVKGPTEKYLDIAQYYHMFVGKTFEFPIENFYALITFPAPLREENSYIWGHGAPSGEIHFKKGKVEVKATKVPPKTFIEARVLFPKELVYMAPDIEENMKDKILAEEKINTENTVIARVNDANRKRLLSVGIAGVMLYIGVIIAYEVIQTKNIVKKFPLGAVQNWEKYTGLPKTKLDITAANLIYENKGAMNYFITILMKLSHNKYLEIIALKETVDKSLDAVDENFLAKVQIAEKVCTDLGIVGDPIEIAKILSVTEKGVRQEKAKELHIKLSEINNVKYKLDLKAIEKAEKENKLDVDEKEVIKLLKTVIAAEKALDSSFEKQIKRAIKKDKSKLTLDVFKEAKKRFAEEIENANGIIYIEQYQIINYLVKSFTSFHTRYNTLIKQEKTKRTKEDVYSIEKENKYNNILFKPVLQIGILAFLIYIILSNLVGDLQFNEIQYFIAASLSLVTSLVLLFIHKFQSSKLHPHLTTLGMNIRAEYQGLFNFLNNDSFIAEYPEKSIIIWGEFLVLATYFGIASKVLKTLRKVHPQVIKELESNNYSLAQSYYTWNMVNIVSTSQRNIAMAQAATSGYGGSSGGGGGFSSGGGGGFGGGGGGGR